MKLFGYTGEDLSGESIQPSKLAEVTLVATPEELRKISAFLQAAANHMESMGASYSHEHLADKQPGFSRSPHFVVSSLQNNER
jgi:hypothetical protein